jgi:CDP-2,3-bis-(O-geranylgeranyl)-sn-glycerol synthase
MDYLLNAFLFFLPAGVANAAPLFATRIPWIRRFDNAMDFGKHYKGKRIFGPNKTWRGFMFGTFMAGVASLLISYFLIPNSADAWYTFLVGASLGAGALAGDAIESFFKRQRGIPPGKSWFPFDQIDYIIGGLIFVYPLTLIPVILMAGIFVLYFGLHLLFSYLGYLVGLKSNPI